MADRTELKITSGLRNALGKALTDAMPPSPTIVLAACFESLARRTGLADTGADSESASIEAAGIPPKAEALLRHLIADGAAGPITDDAVRNRLYAELRSLAVERDARRVVHRPQPPTIEAFLEVAQIYWNLEARATRADLPIRSGITLPNGMQAAIKAPYANVDLAEQNLSARGRFSTRDPAKEAGQAFYNRGARLALLVAESIVGNSSGPPVGAGILRSAKTGRGVEWSIGWPAADVTTRLKHIGGAPSSASSASTLEAAVRRAAIGIDMLPGLALVTPRTEHTDPSTFLSGARMNGADVARFAVTRRVDFNDLVLNVDGVADRVTAGDSVAFLVAGAGEGKSTYLSALTAALVPDAIVFTWQGKTPLEWQKLQTFRDEVLSAYPIGPPASPPIVIVGELETRLTPEQENALIDMVQSIPAGMAPPGTSIVLAGRPTWLNRVRYRATTGQTI